MAKPRTHAPEQETQIELRLPADLSRSHVARSLAASIAVSEDYDLDQIADLRLAVDEVCATVIPLAMLGSTMTCRFEVEPDSIEFTAEVVCSERPHVVQEGSFGWQVLLTLTDDAEVTVVPAAEPASPFLLRLRIRTHRNR